MKLPMSMFRRPNLSLRKSITLVSLTITVAYAQVCLCKDREEQHSGFDVTVDQQHDFAIAIDGRQIKDSFTYPGSKLYPLTMAEVKYRLANRQGSAVDTSSSLQPYEDFWYYNGKAIGLRRHQTLDIPSGKTGLMVVHSEKVDQDSLQSVTNAIVRVSLELQANDIQLSSVTVPQKIFQDVAEQLERLDFGKTMSMDTGPQFSIHLLSSSSRDEQYYYYRKNQEGSD